MVELKGFLEEPLAAPDSAPALLPMLMHCEKCNVDFGENLRYCKWCGETLVEPPRVTSELHTCPSCAAAIQPSWAYCKSCGERLHATPREPVGAVCPRCGTLTSPGALNCVRCGEDLTDGAAARASQDSADTSIIAMCSSCGERLDTGSLYCKACGSAVYAQEVPFGGSALLCGVCNGYSPFGSRVCRTCGAPLGPAQQTVVDRPVPTPDQLKKQPTLPDLDEHLPVTQVQPIQQPPEVQSGANTLVFTGDAQDDPNRTSRNRATVETNVLPGSSGSRAEHQAPTAIMQMARITGPVDEAPNDEHLSPQAPPPGDTVGAGDAIGLGEAVLSNETAEAAGESPVGQSQTPAGGAAMLGYGGELTSPPPVGSENRTEVFLPGPQQQPSSARPPSPEDNVSTKEFVPPQPPLPVEATREMHSMDHGAANISPTRQVGSWPQQPGNVGIQQAATREYGQPDVGVSSPPPSSQTLPRKRAGATIASAIVAAMIVGAAVFVAWWFLFGRSKPAPKPPLVVEPAPPVATEPEKPAAPVVPEGMVMIPAGTYTIGRDDGDPIEQPQHKVDLPAFLIDRTEVTNSAYKKFVDATGHRPPENWTGTNYPEGRGESPVTSVTWQDAADYAKWANKRLPSEAEWEAAARGLDGRIYPWGRDWLIGAANIELKPDQPTAEQYPSGLKNVGSYPKGASALGVMDLIGNAWEWVADEINLYPGNTASSLDLDPSVTYRVIRGGAYDGNKVHDATYRGYLDGGTAYPKVGFRCARDAR